MASELATALSKAGWLSQSTRKSPFTDADRPPGSVAVTVAVMTSGSASAGVTAFQSSSASASKNKMWRPSGYPLTCDTNWGFSVSTSWLWSAGTDAV